MSTSKIYTLTILIMIVVIGLSSVCIAEELGTAFTYQGRLINNNIAADGLYDFQFTLYDDPNILYGYQIGDTVDVNDLDVVEGYFTAVLDFGDDPDIFNEDARWLQIGVRAGQSEDTDEYTILEPLQQIMPTPYAYYPFSASDTKPYDPPSKDPGTGDHWVSTGNDAYYKHPGGNVGIGSTVPQDALDLGSGTAGKGITWGGSAGTARLSSIFAPYSGGGLVFSTAFHGSTSVDSYLSSYTGTLANSGIRLNLAGASAGEIQFFTDAATAKTADAAFVPTERMRIDTDGNVGIGSTVPQDALDLGSATAGKGITWGGSKGTARLSSIFAPYSGGGLVFSTAFHGSTSVDSYLSSYTGTLANSGIRLNLAGASAGEIQFFTDAATAKTADAAFVPTERMRIDTDGNVGIGTTNPTAKLHVAGTTKTQVLEITGADLAEKFPTTDMVEPGMVLEIDPDQQGHLRKSRSAYSTLVAGIVSGANNFHAGAILGNLPGNEDVLPIALAGRVYCWCDADSGAINPGDLLTTSDTPGHAMKVTDYSKSAGAIIGKAMSKLENGKGLVLVLVSLQ